MHTNSKLLFEKYAKSFFKPEMRILEIGPDGFPSAYQTIAGSGLIKWDTLDVYEDPRLTYTAASEYVFPIPDNTYDIVLSGQVIEHVRKVWIWLPEVARVCKVGGMVITVNPVSWPYHEAPIDCWRMFPEAMKALYEDSSLDVSLSRWESLEPVRSPRRMPGRSAEQQSKRLRFLNRFLGLFGVPVECAFDTITVGTKLAR